MKRLAYILIAVLAIASCARETFQHPTEAQAPQSASDYEPVVTVDQEINQVTFSLDQKGVIPVWLFQDSKGEYTIRTAQNGAKRIFAVAGDYTVRMQVMNAAGITPDYKEVSFHIDNTIVNFDRYYTFLAGGVKGGETAVEWRVDNELPGHLGCGPSGTDATEWYSANANDKVQFGLYEDRVTFNANGTYTYNPGADGCVYVNIGVTAEPFASAKGDATEDFMVAVEEQSAEYEFTVEGNDVYLVLPANTLFPYIPNDAFWADPRLKVASISKNSVELIADSPDIAWRVVLTSGAAPVKFNGFKYDADSNLWKPADAAHTYSQYYAPGWSPIDNPAVTQNGGTYSMTFPAATTDQWQAQFHVIPDAAVAVSSDKTYDFSVILNSSTDIKGVTLKLTDTSDDGNYLFVERTDLKAFEETIFWLSDVPGIDAASVKMVFDFGGCPENTEVSISNITLKDHAVDDGTVLPEVDGGDDQPETGAHFDIEGETNLWRSATIEEMFYFYAPGWNQIADPEVTAKDWVYTFTLPEATTEQWQAQVAFRTTMSSSADKRYDFCCTVQTSQDVPGVTIKLVKTGDDNVFYTADRHDLKAYEDFVYQLPDMEGIDMEKISLFFDFGGNPAGTEVTVKDVCFQEHQAPAGAVSFDYNSEDNLWKPADAAHTYSQYYAPGWAPIDNPAVTNNGSSYSFTLSQATTDQWQAQFHIIPDAAIALSAEKTYDFQVKVETSQNVPGVTFKFTDASDDGNFLFVERRDITAFEEFTFEMTNLAGIDAASVKMVFDFGGCPAETEVTIKDITLQEHK